MMDREILFRGQTRKKGEKVNIAGELTDGNWVYGGIFPGDGDFSVIYGGKTEHEIDKYVVYTDTVGQYTGLTDKNSVKIFEGDIVEGNVIGDMWQGEIVWIEAIAGFGVRYFHRAKNDPTAWENSTMLKYLNRYKEDEFNAEVIGNIHDNPELLDE